MTISLGLRKFMLRHPVSQSNIYVFILVGIGITFHKLNNTSEHFCAKIKVIRFFCYLLNRCSYTMHVFNDSFIKRRKCLNASRRAHDDTLVQDNCEAVNNHVD